MCVVHAAARRRWDSRANESPTHTAKNFTLGGVCTWLVHILALHVGKNRIGMDKGGSNTYAKSSEMDKSKGEMQDDESAIIHRQQHSAYMHIHGQSVNP